ncbi:hypothetical protein QYE76_005675 [Lolium multiflorum]|uniref:Retroviral polymerase SH3-like domain-containing protein n=1 Tax=Lolium multiflorum TaxID=4521 RepID=A0AAD8RU81_LOLMU|nr:hypothetical protein QYE76_005675 [Lolium multiflorum]
MLRTLNDTVRTQLTHASMPPELWAESLATATFVLNHRPCRARQLLTPFELLYCTPLDYSNLRVFGCLCFPNTTPTSPHKLAPRSAPCVFLGYSVEHKALRLRLFAYLSLLDLKPRNGKATVRETFQSRRHREAKIRGQSLCSGTPPGRCPEGFSIDITAISIDTTAIFITAIVSYDEEGVVLHRG